TCAALGIGFVAFSPLGRGYLAGTIDAAARFGDNDNRAGLPRFTPEALAANRPIVALLETIVRGKDATPAQIALAWLLAQRPWLVPIPGTTKRHRLEENLGAARIRLSADDLREIATAASKITVEGARYPEKLEQMTGR